MNWEIKTGVEVASRPLVIDESPERNALPLTKESGYSQVSENQTTKSLQEKIETTTGLDISNLENKDSSKSSLTGEDSEKKFTEDISECVSSCLSKVICNVEANAIPIADSTVDYRTSHNFSEDSEEHSDSWEDIESDSSTSSSSDSSSSTSVSTSSLASGEDSDADIFSNRENNDKGPPRTKGELTLDELPPIQNLHITVPSNECMEIGKITSIVEQLVVIQAYKDTPALDLDSVLFLKEGKQMLGHVFDVFGPVKEPCYCVRFNSPQHVNEHGVHVGMKVYCAPNIQEHSHFVFLSELLRQKGCDASWEHNNEPPPSVIEYSDDEQERQARRNAKLKRQGKADLDDEQNKKHQTYEKQMNARNLRMSEQHRNHPGKREQLNTGAVAKATAVRNQMEKSGQFRRNMGINPAVGSTFTPWGEGPGQIRQHSGSWKNIPGRHGPPRGSMQSRPSRFVRPPAFLNMPNYMQYQPALTVPYPTTFLQNVQSQQPLFDTSIPPPPLPQPSSGVDSSIQMFREQTIVDQQYNLARSGSVPQNLPVIDNFRQRSTPPPFYRSESMPSLLPTLQPHNYTVSPNTRPPPSVASIMSHQFGSITFGNPVAFSSALPHPLRPTDPNQTPPASAWLVPPPPPPQAPQSSSSSSSSHYLSQQPQQNQSSYS